MSLPCHNMVSCFDPWFRDPWFRADLWFSVNINTDSYPLCCFPCAYINRSYVEKPSPAFPMMNINYCSLLFRRYLHMKQAQVSSLPCHNILHNPFCDSLASSDAFFQQSHALDRPGAAVVHVVLPLQLAINHLVHPWRTVPMLHSPVKRGGGQDTWRLKALPMMHLRTGYLWLRTGYLWLKEFPMNSQWCRVR